MINVKTLFVGSLFAIISYTSSYDIKAVETDDINKIIEQQIEQKNQHSGNSEKQDNKITISKEELMKLIDNKVDENNKKYNHQDGKLNNLSSGDSELENQDDKIIIRKKKSIIISKEELMKLIDNRIKETNNKSNNQDKKTDTLSADKENEVRKLVRAEIEKQNKKEMLNAIQQDKTDNNNIDTSGYQSKTDKYNKWNVNFGTTLYYNPYNKKGLNAGLTLDLYYRWESIGFLVGVDGIWHNVISGDYRKFKSDNAGEAGEIRERYSILFKTGFIGFVNDDWSWQLYMLLGWSNSSVKVWDIDGYGTSVNQSYARGGLGLKVVYKRIYMGITWLAGAPGDIHYFNRNGEDVIFNIHRYTGKYGTEYTYIPTEQNVLLSFGIKIF